MAFGAPVAPAQQCDGAGEVPRFKHSRLHKQHGWFPCVLHIQPRQGVLPSRDAHRQHPQAYLLNILQAMKSWQPQGDDLDPNIPKFSS